jgi:hypothetical protein
MRQNPGHEHHSVSASSFEKVPPHHRKASLSARFDIPRIDNSESQPSSARKLGKNLEPIDHASDDPSLAEMALPKRGTLFRTDDQQCSLIGSAQSHAESWSRPPTHQNELFSGEFHKVSPEHRPENGQDPFCSPDRWLPPSQHLISFRN